MVFLGLVLLAGCVSQNPAEPDANLVRISVETRGATSFERILRAAQPLADQACAAQQKQAQWVVATTGSQTRTKLAFACW